MAGHELDAAALRSYARRDWGAPERLARRDRAALSRGQRVQLAIELYEGMQATCPHWPDDAARRKDYEMHLRLRSLLDQAPNVGAG